MRDIDKSDSGVSFGNEWMNGWKKISVYAETCEIDVVMDNNNFR